MELWRHTPAGRLHWVAFFVLLALAAAAGCRRDNSVAIDRNKPPETFVTEGPASSNDPDNPTLLYYRAHLFWRGEDQDGTVAGFRWALDDTTDPGAWAWTTQTDSTFRFEVAEIGAKEHLFLIRAVDNQGKQDATPDTVRFESFTLCAPEIDLSAVTVSAESPTLGSVAGLTTGDTVEVFSDVTVCWDGSDCDGFIVGWETKIDNEVAWAFHDVDQKCRTISSLGPGLHIVNVRAIDDAGAKSSNIARVRVVSNFAPESLIDPASLVATLDRPWLGDQLVIGPGVAPGDTLPLGATICASWASTDVDGPIESFAFTFGGNKGTTAPLSVSGDITFGGVCTDTTGPVDLNGLPTPQTLDNTDTSPGGEAFVVKGIDIHSNVEQRPDTLRLRINFQPTVQFTGPDTVDVVADGAPVQFPFVGADIDSDPASLSYRWLFSYKSSPTQPVDPPESQLFVTESFTPSLAGPRLHRLILWAQDPSGATRESEPDTTLIRVSLPGPSPGRTARPASDRGTR